MFLLVIREITYINKLILGTLCTLYICCEGLDLGKGYYFLPTQYIRTFSSVSL